MALAIPGKRISREDYLQGELASEIRHEYVAGNVYAMSGGTLNHQRIAGNFMRMAGNHLAGKVCFPTGSDFKLLVALGGGEEAFYDPDGMIICVPVPGDALFTDSPSVQEHATPLAGASVERGVEVHVTDVDDRAASGGYTNN